MIYPKPLSKGECIGLVAPASPITKEERDQCIQVLEKLGFQVKLAEGLFGESLCEAHEKNRQGTKERGWSPNYLAGTARQRAKDLNQIFQDPQVQAVFCVRGGYGSAGVLPYLDYPKIRENPKIFVGYSDITAVHMALQKHCRLVTFHGPMVKSNFIGELRGYEWESLWNMIGKEGKMASEGKASFENPAGEKIQRIDGSDKESAAGILTGGNLSVFLRLAATGYLPDLRGKILFLEDINESVARIHMALIQMEQMGVFDQVEGILLGGFLDCGEGVEQMMAEFFQEHRVPVLKNICSDHRKNMGTLPLGAMCEIHAASGELCFCCGLTS